MRILFASTEGRTAQLQKQGVKNVLTSYLAWNKKDLDEVTKAYDFVFIDSGSTAFYSAEPKLAPTHTIKKAHLPAPDVYIEKYITWLFDNQAGFNYFSELDIGSLGRFRTEGKRWGKGREWVLAARQKFVDAGLKAKLVPVYHEEYFSLEDLEDMCKEYPYVALAKMPRIQDYNPIFEIGRKYGTKFHGFGMNRDTFLKKIPFYSVDTTAWLAGTRYGTTFSFKGQKLYQTDDKNFRRTMKQKLQTHGIDFLSVIADKSSAVDSMNALAWREYGDHLTRVSKPYWKEGLLPNDPVAKLDENGNPIKPFDPTDNLPARTRGKIMEIRQDKEVEARRISNHQEVMRANTFNWKSGEFSAYKKTPSYLNSYLDSLDDLDFSDKDSLRGAVEYLLKQNLKRIAIAQFFELSDGGVQDRGLSVLIKDTTNMIKELGGLNAPPAGTPPAGDTNIEFNIGDTQGLTNDQRLTARAAINEALTRITDKTKEQ